MSPLPSFVELMESLGLAADSKLPVQLPVSRPSSSASSESLSRQSSASPPPPASRILSKKPRAESPTIIVSQYDAPNETDKFKRRASSGNIKAARFSPYASTTTRRGSMSALGDHQRDPEQQQHNTHKAPQSSASRRSSGSSHSSSNSSADSIPPVPPLPARRSRGGSLERLKVSSAAASCTPISSFARRRSPQASPTSPSFASARARGASAELPSPVMLPTLPPMLAESFATFSFPSGKENSGVIRRSKERRSRSRSPRVSPMDLDQESQPFVKHHQAGLRISSFHRQIAPVA